MADETEIQDLETQLPDLVRATLAAPVPPERARQRLFWVLSVVQLATVVSAEPPERALARLDDLPDALTRGVRLPSEDLERLLERLRERLCELLRAGLPLAAAIEQALREFLEEIRKVGPILAAGVVVAAVAPGLAKLLLAALIGYLVAELYQAVTAGLCGPLPVPPTPLPPQPAPEPAS